MAEYKKEAFAMFEGLITNVESTIASRIFRIQVMDRPMSVMPTEIRLEKPDVNQPLEQSATQPQPRAAAPAKIKGSVSDLAQALAQAQTGAKANPGSEQVKIGRNALCPCDSGLKYKKCGLINAPEHKG